jgi:hypothetical protein
MKSKTHNIMKSTPILILLSACIFLSSCLKERLEGNGHIVSEVRTLKGFTGVENSGSKRVHVSYGPEFKVELRGSSNLIPAYRTRVINGNLELGYERVNVRYDDLEVHVTMPEIRRANLSGSGKILISGDFPAQDYFESRISGSGEIRVYDAFDVTDLDLAISGSGKADLLPIQSERADAHISGSGEAKIHVNDHLKASISGSGKVYYAGSPTVEMNVSGSGKVVKY